MGNASKLLRRRRNGSASSFLKSHPSKGNPNGIRGKSAKRKVKAKKKFPHVSTRAGIDGSVQKTVHLSDDYAMDLPPGCNSLEEAEQMELQMYQQRTPSEVDVMRIISQYGYVSQAELAKSLHMGRGTVSQIAERLCNRRALEKKMCPLEDQNGALRRQAVYCKPGSVGPELRSSSEDQILELLAKEHELSAMQIHLKMRKSPSLVRGILSELQYTGRVQKRTIGNRVVYSLTG
jgi:Mn-dependent DtxR family transcriptional regulator